MATKHKIQKTQITKQISAFKKGKFSWFDIVKISSKEIDYLGSKHKIESRDLADLNPKQQRPLITVRSNYVFMVLLFPYEDKDAGIIRSEKVSFFIFPNKLITLHQTRLNTMKYFRNEVVSDNPSLSPQTLINRLLSHLYDNTFPILGRLSDDIDQVESTIFDENFGDKKTVKNIFNIELRVVDFRKILRSHVMIIDKLVSVLPQSTKTKGPHNDLQELQEYPRIIWTNLESQMEAIDTLKETYESLSAFNLNDIMKTLTIISMIIAPMAVIGAIFGMNFKYLPYASHPQGFLLIILLMLWISLVVFLFFRKKRWL